MTDTAGAGLTPPKEIAKVMNSGEVLYWFDHPSPFAIFQTKLKSFMMAFPFFILAFVWFNVFLKPDMPPYMGVIGWIFAGFGAWQLLVPAWAFIMAKLFMYYALTDSRLLIVQFYPKHKTKTVNIKDIVHILKLKGADKTGTLIFEVPDLSNKKATKEGQFVKAAGTFYGINNVDRIESAINQLRGIKPTAPAPVPGGAPAPAAASGPRPSTK